MIMSGLMRSLIFVVGLTIFTASLIMAFEPPTNKETLSANGILIGADESYARDLARFNNLYVRVSLKACNQRGFSALTGAIPEGFQLQLQALKNLARFGVNVHPALMISFSSPEAVNTMKKRLSNIRKDFAEVEIEELVVYGDLEDRLIKANLLH